MLLQSETRICLRYHRHHTVVPSAYLTVDLRRCNELDDYHSIEATATPHVGLGKRGAIAFAGQ